MSPTDRVTPRFLARSITGPVLLTTLCLLDFSFVPRAAAAPPETAWKLGEEEKFLQAAEIVDIQLVGKGLTKSQKAVLSDGSRTHPAHVQTINQYQAVFHGKDGSQEKEFKDSWKFNVAAYRLAKLLNLTYMTPPSVERLVNGKPASLTWWIDGVLMDEKTRRDKKIEPPDSERWRNQMATVRVFDQLIYNMDRNQENLIITEDWNVWMIDHTRSFRRWTTLRNPSAITHCEPALLTALKKLKRSDVTRQLSPYLTLQEIAGLMARRDLIVDLVQNQNGVRRRRSPDAAPLSRPAPGVTDRSDAP